MRPPRRPSSLLWSERRSERRGKWLEIFILFDPLSSAFLSTERLLYLILVIHRVTLRFPIMAVTITTAYSSGRALYSLGASRHLLFDHLYFSGTVHFSIFCVCSRVLVGVSALISFFTFLGCRLLAFLTAPQATSWIASASHCIALTVPSISISHFFPILRLRPFPSCAVLHPNCST